MVCVLFLLYSAYNDVKKETINQLNIEQLTHAKQAANGIQMFFGEYDVLLTYLVSQNSVINFDDNGKKLIDILYNSHAPEIQAITRIDEKGKIIYTIPNNSKFMGADISHQEHVQRLLKTHQRVVSDIFETVQGYRSIAYYGTGFQRWIIQGRFSNSNTLRKPGKNYLRNIKVRKSGFAFGPLAKRNCDL